MSEELGVSGELGVRSEELIQMLLGCAESKTEICAEGKTEICAQCRLKDVIDCSGALMSFAADEIERLRAELSANEYQRLAMRTKPVYYGANDQLINAALGLCGESGECIDLLKKYFYQGHDLDEAKLADELGDVAWYLALAADALGVTLGEIMERNIEKLRKRYPEGFDPERSVHRAES